VNTPCCEAEREGVSLHAGIEELDRELPVGNGLVPQQLADEPHLIFSPAIAAVSL
jgi:hypothetical protein